MTTTEVGSIGILSLRFNQDSECFVCGCVDGFSIFNSDPLRKVQSQVLDGGVGPVEMLFRCNYLAIVGGGTEPAFQPTNVVIWDCSLQKAVSVLELEDKVLSVRLSRDRIVVVQELAIRVFSFSDIPKEQLMLKTWQNPDGVSALSTTSLNPLLAFPSPNGTGSIAIVDLNRPIEDPASIIHFKAHDHAVHNLSFNNSGTLIGTASDKGTLIRVFDTTSGTLLKEFRRGSNSATISCINFSEDSTLLCVSSNHPTIHVFQLLKSPRNLTKYLKGGVAASFSRLNISHSSGQKKFGGISACSFGKNSESIIALGPDGSYYKFYFEKTSGKCSQLNYCLFAELNNNGCGTSR